MFTADAARIIGISPKALRTFLRNRNTGVGSGARYEFSHEEVVELEREYWEANGHTKTVVRSRTWLGDGGNKGLPVDWMNDPEKQATFLAERKERVERLGARLREVGLDVPQMTEQTLKINGRAMAAALLNPKRDDDE